MRFSMKFLPVMICACIGSFSSASATIASLTIDFDSPAPVLPNLLPTKLSVSPDGNAGFLINPALMGGHASGNVFQTTSIDANSILTYVDGDPYDEYAFPEDIYILGFDIRPAEDGDGLFPLSIARYNGEFLNPLFVPYGRWTHIVGTFRAFPLSENSNRWLSVAATAEFARSFGGNKAFYVDNVKIGWDVPSVPEPSVWATLIVGFGITGAILRRRRGIHFAT